MLNNEKSMKYCHISAKFGPKSKIFETFIFRPSQIGIVKKNISRYSPFKVLFFEVFIKGKGAKFFFIEIGRREEISFRSTNYPRSETFIVPLLIDKKTTFCM